MKNVKRFFATLIIVVSIICNIMPTTAFAATTSSNSPAAVAISPEATAFALQNAERAKAGLPALVWNDQLAKDAAVRAQECEISFSHRRPDGTDWWTLDSANMYGENLAWGYDENIVVSAWMASPSHKANILSAEYTRCGIAFFESSNGTLYCACEFY